MDYLKYFNLIEDPFKLTPDPFFFYPSQEHSEILSSLNYAIEEKEGFSLVVGEPGTGKTTILKILMGNWKDKAEIALIMTPRLSPEEFLQAVLEDINIKLQATNKNEMIKAFRDVLMEHSSTGRSVLIIVDEAQNLPDETLEEMRLLSNLETEKEKLLQIILIGQPELKKKLQRPNLKQLDQRITIRATLRPLSASETSDYINFRLIKAGKGSVIFEDDAKKSIYKLSQGIPRLINLISSRSLMAAFVGGNVTVKKSHVNHAIEHLSDTPISRKKPLQVIGYGVLGILLVTALTFGIFKFMNRVSSMPAISQQQQIAKAAGVQAQPVSQSVNQDNGKRIATIVVDSANLRGKPSLNSEIVSWASKGFILRVMGEFAEPTGKKWYKVKLMDGRECWISDKVVEITKISDG